jgi:hypothetical protein
MSLNTRYDNQSPIFNYNERSGGVLFPFQMVTTGATTDYLDLDSADLSTIVGTFVAPYACALVTAQAYAVSDAEGAKSAASTVEPTIGLVYGANTPIATVDVGTSCGVISCIGAGPIGTVWAGTTDLIELTEGQEVGAYIKTQAASSEASGPTDGGAIVVLWVAIANAPA